MACVCVQAQVQRPDIANPPTMFLAVESLLAHTLEAAQGADATVAADGSTSSSSPSTAGVASEAAATLEFVKCVPSKMFARAYAWLIYACVYATSCAHACVCAHVPSQARIFAAGPPPSTYYQPFLRRA